MSHPTFHRARCRDVLPAEAAEYNVQVDGVSSLLPMFLTFDGQRWLGLEELERGFGERRDVYWFPNDPAGGPFVIGSKGVPLHRTPEYDRRMAELDRESEEALERLRLNPPFPPRR
jgi:hypothetical protein